MNIAGTQAVDDPEYRYKMPRLIGKIEGKGNGIKTVVMNCNDIAASLHRSTAEVCKFFGCELGAQSKYDKNTDRAVVNGAFDSTIMQNHLSKYIEKFVLCPSCRLPETKYKFKGQLIFHKCYACGTFEPVDMNHKLTTFIIKEHSAAKRSKKGVDKEDKKKKKEKSTALKSDEPEREGSSSPREKSEKKEKKEKKDKKKKKIKDKGSATEDADDDVEWHTDLSPEAVAARAAEAEAIEAAACAAMQAPENGDNGGEWHNELSPEAEAIKSASNAANRATKNGEEVVAILENLQVDDQSAIDAASANVHSFLQSNHSNAEIYDEVCRQQTYAALPACDRLLIFFKAAFDDHILARDQVGTFVPVLEKLVESSDAQKRLIALCEHFCAVQQPTLLTSFPVVLKKCYDMDLLDEEYLIAWSKGQFRKEFAHPQVNASQFALLQKALVPFIEWLENADEEESDEDDE